MTRVRLHRSGAGQVASPTIGSDTMEKIITVPSTGEAELACPRCGTSFLPQRRNQKFCSRPCAKAATRNSSRGSRPKENATRARWHYGRAAWLCYDLHRMHVAERSHMLLAIVEAASGPAAALRNILLDPVLLSAARDSPAGKLYPDSRYPDVPNLAKMVHAFCLETWGVGLRNVLLVDGRPANRDLSKERSEIVPPQTYGALPEPPLRDYVTVKPSEFFRELAELRRLGAEQQAS